MAVSVAVALAACEVAVRVLGRAPVVYRVGLRAENSAYRVSDDPILGYEMKPGFRSDHPDFNATFPSINADGQRDLERAVAKPAGTTRIIVLGDSVAVGLGIRELDDLISRQLERAIARPDVEVLNLAVMGYNTRGEVELLETRGLRYAPDLVVVLFVENDYMELNGDSAACTFARPGILNALFLHSALFRLSALQLDLFHFGLEVDPHYTSRRQREGLANDRARRGFAGQNHVDQALGILADLGRTHGFRSLIAVWPMFDTERIFEQPALFVPDRPDVLRIEEDAARHDIRTVRLSAAFQRDYAQRAAAGETQSPSLLYTFDTAHPDPVGTRVAAEAIRDALTEPPALLAQTPPPP